MAAVKLKDADGHGRALAKGVSWRIIGTLDTFLWSLLITKQAFSAGSIASLEALTKIVLYYLHERAWRLVRWGRLEASDAEAAPAATTLASPPPA